MALSLCTTIKRAVSTWTLVLLSTEQVYVVRLPDYRRLCVRASLQTTAAEFKQYIQEHEGLAARKQRLLWHGHFLEDTETLQQIHESSASHYPIILQFADTNASSDLQVPLADGTVLNCPISGATTDGNVYNSVLDAQFEAAPKYVTVEVTDRYGGNQLGSVEVPFVGCKIHIGDMGKALGFKQVNVDMRQTSIDGKPAGSCGCRWSARNFDCSKPLQATVVPKENTRAVDKPARRGLSAFWNLLQRSPQRTQDPLQERLGPNTPERQEIARRRSEDL